MQFLPGDTSATQILLNKNNLGNLPKCIQKLIELIHWGEVDKSKTEDGKVRAKGVSCFWKKFKYTFKCRRRSSSYL